MKLKSTEGPISKTFNQTQLFLGKKSIRILKISQLSKQLMYKYDINGSSCRHRIADFWAVNTPLIKHQSAAQTIPASKYVHIHNAILIRMRTI